MLFLYIHTHPVDKCLADKPEQIRQMRDQIQQDSAKAGIKMIGGYSAPHEHTIYFIFEADNIAAVEQALIPMTTWGNARMIPIVTVGEML